MAVQAVAWLSWVFPGILAVFLASSGNIPGIPSSCCLYPGDCRAASVQVLDRLAGLVRVDGKVIHVNPQNIHRSRAGGFYCFQKHRREGGTTPCYDGREVSDRCVRCVAEAEALL